MHLLVQTADGKARTFPLQSQRVTVGRASAVELSFPEDIGLSRQHFAFEPDGEDWAVQDLGSKNGTFVNNIPLKGRLTLKPGDRVTAGHVTVVFAPEPASSGKLVVFEGEGESERREASTTVTSLDAARVAPDHGVGRKRGETLRAHAGADPRGPGAGGKPAGGRIVSGDARPGNRGRQRAAGRAPHSGRRPAGAARAQGRGLPHQHGRARPRAEGEVFHPGPRCAAR